MQPLEEARWTPLHAAALDGDVPRAAALLEAGSSLDAALASPVVSAAIRETVLRRPGGKSLYPSSAARLDAPARAVFDAGVTPLHVAAAAGHASLVAWALDHGAELASVDSVGGTVLHHAARGGDVATIDALLAAWAHAFPRKKSWVHAATKAAASYAFRDAGTTPLHVALEHGHLAVVHRLLDAGADPTAPSKHFPAVYFVALSGNVDALALLRERGATLVSTPPVDATAEAVTRGDLAMVLALIDAGNAPREAWLREATLRGHDELRRALLARGLAPLTHPTPFAAARANDVDALASMHARGVAVTDSEVLLQAAGSGHLRVVEFLLAHGGDLTRPPGSATALHAAIEQSHAEVALRLVDAGAPLDAKDAHGNPPLFVASMRRGMERVLEALIERGANPYEVLRHGNSAWKVTEASPTYRAILARTAHVPDPTARGWVPPSASRVLVDASLRPTFAATYQALFDELVPPTGAAPTLQGELVRVSHRLLDEAMRNGNGNFDARHRAMATVLETICGPPFEEPRLTEIRKAVHAVAGGTLDGGAHQRVAHAVVEWCVAHPLLEPWPRAR